MNASPALASPNNTSVHHAFPDTVASRALFFQQANKKAERDEAKTSMGDVKKDPINAGRSTFWLNNLGFFFYAAAGLVKRGPDLFRAINHKNPSGIVGTLMNVTCYPFLLNHDMFSKLYMQVGNHVLGMSKQSKNMNTHISMENTKAELQGIPAVSMQTTGLANMEEWFDTSLFSRTAKGGFTKLDFKNWGRFGRFLVEDQKNGAKNFMTNLKDLGELTREAFKTVFKKGHKFSIPQGLRLIVNPKARKSNALALRNNYIFQHGMIFGSMSIILAESLCRVLGVHHFTRFITIPANIALNVVQSIGKIMDVSPVWNGVNNVGVQPWYYKPISLGKIGSVITSAISCIAWNNDTAIGLLRLGSVFRMPYEAFHDIFTLDKQNRAIRPDESNTLTKLSQGMRFQAVTLDALAAGCILGAYPLQQFQQKHGINLNPFSEDFFYRLPKHEREVIWRQNQGST